MSNLTPTSHYLPAAVVSELLKRASAAERPVVENLAIAAGVLWRCKNDRCGVANHALGAPPEHCPKCGRPR
jgi:rubrerythrin